MRSSSATTRHVFISDCLRESETDYIISDPRSTQDWTSVRQHNLQSSCSGFAGNVHSFIRSFIHSSLIALSNKEPQKDPASDYISRFHILMSCFSNELSFPVIFLSALEIQILQVENNVSVASDWCLFMCTHTMHRVMNINTRAARILLVLDCAPGLFLFHPRLAEGSVPLFFPLPSWIIQVSKLSII